MALSCNMVKNLMKCQAWAYVHRGLKCTIAALGFGQQSRFQVLSCWSNYIIQIRRIQTICYKIDTLHSCCTHFGLCAVLSCAVLLRQLICTASSPNWETCKLLSLAKFAALPQCKCCIDCSLPAFNPSKTAATACIEVYMRPM